MGQEQMIRHESVLHGKDCEAIDILIGIHCEASTPYILDCTYNKGTMWKGGEYQPSLTMDINPSFPAQITADFTAMPFPSDTFDVIVFDPPHLPVASASTNSSGIWRKQYGLTDNELVDLRSGDNVSPMFYPFLIEARRVLKCGGIVLAKIADIIHNHRYQWQHIDIINDARLLDMTPCDMMIKTSPSSGNLKSSKWQNVFHLKRAHSHWIVIRNANYDERKDRPLETITRRAI